MEKITYDEARNWFWLRTWLWTAAAAIVSMMAFFAYANGLVRVVEARAWVSVGSGLASVLLGVMAAALSLQMPWMRAAWRIGFLLNGLVCTAISALVAFLICGMVLTFMQNNPPALTDRGAQKALGDALNIAYGLMRLGIGAAAFWGFVYGSWFALRRDRYFVESI